MPLSALEEPSSAPPYSTPSPLACRAPQWKWNPYTDAPLPSLLKSGIIAAEAMSIPAIVEKYQQQVSSLVRTHEDIMFVKDRVQEAINELSSFAGKSAKASADQNGHTLQLAERNRELDLLKHGLDIRIRQFDEDCKEASKLEWILRRKLSAPEDTGKSLQTVQPFQVQPTCEALKRIQDQDRLIKLLQHVLDQNFYHNYTYGEKLRQMRKECFGEELESSGTVQEDSAWFEGRTIQFRIKEGPQLVSSWMKMIRTHPTEEKLPPPPRADPQSLRFISNVHEIDQLTSAVAEGGRKAPSFKRGRDFKELLRQLSQLRSVLVGAAAAANGMEKVILNELTTQIDEQISYASHAAATAEAPEGTYDGKPSQVVRMTKAVVSNKIAEGGKDQAPSHTRDLTLVGSKDKHEAPSVGELRRVTSKSLLRKDSASAPLSTGHSFSKIPSRTLASPRRSRTSVVDAEDQEPKFVTEASREDTFTRRKPSRSPSVSSLPQSPPLLRGASRTVPSPRQSFSKELYPSQTGRTGMTRKPTEEYFPSVEPATGAKESIGRLGGERPSPDYSAPLNGTLSRAGSRTVPTPRRTLSRSLTLRSPREHGPLSPTLLSRAMSSAFLGS